MPTIDRFLLHTITLVFRFTLKIILVVYLFQYVHSNISLLLASGVLLLVELAITYEYGKHRIVGTISPQLLQTLLVIDVLALFVILYVAPSLVTIMATSLLLLFHATSSTTITVPLVGILLVYGFLLSNGNLLYIALLTISIVIIVYLYRLFGSMLGFRDEELQHAHSFHTVTHHHKTQKYIASSILELADNILKHSRRQRITFNKQFNYTHADKFLYDQLIESISADELVDNDTETYTSYVDQLAQEFIDNPRVNNIDFAYENADHHHGKRHVLDAISVIIRTIVQHVPRQMDTDLAISLEKNLLEIEIRVYSDTSREHELHNYYEYVSRFSRQSHLDELQTRIFAEEHFTGSHHVLVFLIKHTLV